MPQVMIALSGKDHKTTTAVWRLAKRSLNPIARRRMGLRGRSSLMRELLLYGFEQASHDPGAFLTTVREESDPLVGRKGRKDKGAENREALLAAWVAFFPADERPARVKGRK